MMAVLLGDGIAMTGHIARPWWVTGLVLVALCAEGCASKRRLEDYTPSSQAGTDAVRAALEAWKSGQPAGDIQGTSPLIHVTDVGRKPDQVLEGFEILGETHGPAGRTIAVTLHLANPTEDVKTRYIVVGIDPLWVYREEDFDLLMHWDHHMPAAATDASSATGSETAPNSDRDPESATGPR